MQHFIERKHLLQWLVKNCTRKSVVRAMDEGTVEHLGAFSKLGPNSKPGWVVRVTSAIGKVWNVEIISWRGRLGIFISDLEPPWEYWDGVDPVVRCGPNKSNSLYDGDKPVVYARRRDEQRSKIRSTDLSSETTEPGVE